MKLIKIAATAAAALTLSLSLASCGSNLSWAAKIDKDTTVPIGLYIYGQAAAYRAAAQDSLISQATDLSEQTVKVSGTDVNANEYLDNEAKKAVKSYVGACLMAKDYQQVLTDEEIAKAAENAASAYETDKEVFEKNGIAQSSLERYYEDVTRKNNLFEAKYGADGTDPISDSELTDYLRANYATIHFIQQYFYNDDGTAMTDAQKDALQKEYESIRKQAESGKLNFAKKCEEYSDGSSSYKGGYANSTSRFDADEEEGAKILALKQGEFTLLVTNSAIALIQKAKLDMDELNLSTYRASYLLEYKYDDFVKELTAYAEKSDSVQFNDKAFEKFSASTRDFSELSIPSYYNY